MKLSFRVIGEPIPQGSMKGYIRGKHVALTSDNPRLHSWREIIGWEARKHVGEVYEGPIRLTAIFHMSRPKSAPKARIYPTVKPDADKLARALGDALTGVVYRDDSAVVTWHIQKVYCRPGEQPGVSVWIDDPAV